MESIYIKNKRGFTPIRSGFTLLELLIVIGIMGILISVASAAYLSTQQRARDTRRKSDLTSWQNALEQYSAANSGAYPNIATCDPGAAYLPAGVPVDPKNVTPYIYAASTCNTTAYCICVGVENTANGNSTVNCGAFSSTGAYFCIKNLQ